MNNTNPLYYLEEKSRYVKNIIKGVQSTKSEFLKGKVDTHNFGKKASTEIAKGNKSKGYSLARRGMYEKSFNNVIFPTKKSKVSVADNIVNKNAIMKKNGGKNKQVTKFNLHK